MKLYLIRHGETQWNLQGRLQGQTDIALNENGIRLAQITAKHMQKIPLHFAVTSPLIRARQTAEILLEGRNIPIYEDARLKEISFGVWEGLGCRKDNYEIPSEHFNDFYENPLQFVPGEKGETVEHLCKRTAEFYEDLISRKNLENQSVLIATHGCALRSLLYHIDPKADFWRGHVPINCSVTIIEVKHGASKIIEEDKIYYDSNDAVDFYSH